MLVLEEENELLGLLVAKGVNSVRACTPVDDQDVAVQLAGGRDKARPVQPTPLPADGLLPLGERSRDISCLSDGVSVR
eukprot:14543497-Alexandrium_andersonii.AAC.1